MKKYVVEPTVSVNGVLFGVERDAVRRKFGRKYRELKRNIFSKNTMDVYDTCICYYDSLNCLEAVEFNDGAKVYINGKCIFPGDLSSLEQVDSKFKVKPDSAVSEKISCGVTLDNNNIICILFGKNGYYE